MRWIAGIPAMRLAEFRTLSVTLPLHDGEGLLGLPARPARGIVLFAHGSGSSRLSPRNAFVAEALQHAGMATLLFDLLTDQEAADRANVSDIPLLANRLDQAATLVSTTASGRDQPLGFFGASTGAAAASVAAAGRRDVWAIVSRGERPDLAGDSLENVTAPTLLIVGGDDPEVLALNRSAYRRLRDLPTDSDARYCAGCGAGNELRMSVGRRMRVTRQASIPR